MIETVLKLPLHKLEFPMSLFDPAMLNALAQLLLGVATLVAALHGRKPPDGSG